VLVLPFPAAGDGAQQQRGDVVGTAVAVRRRQERGACLVAVIVGRKELGDGRLVDGPGQPVRAQQQLVFLAEHDRGERVDRHLFVDADRPGDDATLRMLCGLVPGQPPLSDQLLHQGVIDAQLRQGAVAEQIRAAVADVGEMQTWPLGEHGRQGCPHAVVGGLCGSELDHAAVGLPHGVSQPLLCLGLTRGGGVQLPQRVQSGVGGDLARPVTAHPVGHREDAVAEQVAVLIVIPRFADIRRRVRGDHDVVGLCAHRRTSTTVLPSPI
jgi:hypothetical protein